MSPMPHNSKLALTPLPAAAMAKLVAQLNDPLFGVEVVELFARLSAAATVVTKYARAFLLRRARAAFDYSAAVAQGRGSEKPQPPPYYGRVAIACGVPIAAVSAPAHGVRPVPIPAHMRGLAFSKPCQYGVECARWGDPIHPCLFWHTAAEFRKPTWLGPDGEPLEPDRALKPGSWRRPEPERPKPFVKAPGPALNPWGTPLAGAGAATATAAYKLF